jgi:hypothetical protein
LVSADVFVRAYQQEIFLLGPLDSRLLPHQRLLAKVSTEELRQRPLAYRPQHAKPTDPVPYFGMVRPFSFTSVIEEREVSVDGQILVVLSESKAKLDREHSTAKAKSPSSIVPWRILRAS